MDTIPRIVASVLIGIATAFLVLVLFALLGVPSIGPAEILLVAFVAITVAWAFSRRHRSSPA